MDILKDKELVIFGFDGTIVNLDVDYSAMRDALRAKYNSDKQDINQILESLSDSKREEAYGIMEEYEFENINSFTQNSKIIDFINKNKDKRFAIFSSKLKPTIVYILSNLTMLHRFEFIVPKEEVKKYKPDKEGLLKIFKESGIDKEKIIYICSKPEDLETGRQAGIMAILAESLK